MTFADVAEAIGQILLGWLAADFFSGVFHWFEDRVARESWPLIGPHIVLPNRLHHVQPAAFLNSGVWGRGAITWSMTAAAGGALLFAVGPQPFVLAMIAGGLVVNEVHAWAHGQAPRPVRVLQDTGLIQSVRGHAGHHRGAGDTGYCILTNILNPMLDAMGFWSTLERVVRVRP